MQLAYTCQNGSRYCEPHVRLGLIPAIAFASCPINGQTSTRNRKPVGSICEQLGMTLEILHGGERGSKCLHVPLCLQQGGTKGTSPGCFSPQAQALWVTFAFWVTALGQKARKIRADGQ